MNPFEQMTQEVRILVSSQFEMKALAFNFISNIFQFQLT